MTSLWPAVAGAPEVSAILRQSPEDFLVYEQLGFDLSGEGEHVFLHLEKRELNSMELQQRLVQLSGIPARDIGLSGMKDRNAVTRQWFSVRMAGKPEPDWQELAAGGDVKVLQVQRHLRKLKRGAHKTNRFVLHLRDLHGDQDNLQRRLEWVKTRGFPNYFGEQRFGRGGSSLAQARQWMHAGGRKISRTKRSRYLSTLRAYLFNTLLADRVSNENWNRVIDGDVCMLQGSNSLFSCDRADKEIQQRATCGDIHPGLPLWGRGLPPASEERVQQQAEVIADKTVLADGVEICLFLERMGLELSYRPARVLADDFSWQFCDDGSLQLDFALRAGSYATAVLAELVKYTDKSRVGINVRGKSDSSE